MKRALAILLAIMLLACVPTLAVADAAPKKLVFQVGTEPESMDPTLNDYSSGSMALQSLFRGLYKFSAEGDLVPAMAESCAISEDQTVYTFTLRAGLKWSDGSPLTANDFALSWQRTLAKEVGSETAYCLFNIKNAREFNMGNVAWEEVGVKVEGDTTLIVTLNNPTPWFLSITATTAFMPIKMSNVDAAKNADDPNGNNWVKSVATYACNGPFMPQEFKFGEKYIFVKNPNYYNAAEVKLDELDFLFLSAPETALLAYENSEVDVALSVNTDAEAKFKETPELFVTQRIGFRYYHFNCANPVVNDARVRKALSLSINRKVITEAILKTSSPALYGFIPHAFPDIANPEGPSWREVNGNAFEEDLALAKQLLADAGYPDGKDFPKLRLCQSNDATLVKVAEAMQQMWKVNLGIDVEVVSVESKVYWDEMDAGNFDIGYTGYTGDYLDPLSLLYNFEGTQTATNNRWVNADYDALMAKALSGITGAEREQLFKDAEALLSIEFPVMPVYSYVSMALVKPHVKGFTRNYIGHANFEYADIEK